MCFQTYTGNILIAVNPFTKLPHLYDSYMMAQYKGAAFGELSPHPFAVADAAYRHSSDNTSVNLSLRITLIWLSEIPFLWMQTYGQWEKESIHIGQWWKWGWKDRKYEVAYALSCIYGRESCFWGEVCWAASSGG